MTIAWRWLAKPTSAFAALILGLVMLSPAATAVHEDPSQPNDPLFNPDPPTIGLGQWGPRQIRAEEAWHTSTGAGTVIAIVDTGIDLDHEDLAAKVVPGQTFLECGDAGCGNGDWESGPPNRVASKSTHGTHVAGIAAAHTNNGIGIAGVAPDAALVPVKVLDEQGGTFEDVARGIRWAADNGADVINLSLGIVILGLLPGSQAFTLLGLESEVDDAIAYAHSRGVVVVAAAGNESFALCSDPAFGSGALCVTATDSHELRAGYSNEPINEELLGVAAPGGGEIDFIFFCGGGILSTVPAGTGSASFADICGYPTNLAYDEFIGTSMAAPHVAGQAALLATLGCTREQTVDLITSTARNPLTGQRGEFDPVYGYGIVDAVEALAAAATQCSSPSSNSPPEVNDDRAMTTKGTPVSVDVLANDSDPDGDPLTVGSVTQPDHGSSVIDPDDTITYTPEPGFTGRDRFEYTACDPGGLCGTATVHVRVRPGAHRHRGGAE